MNSESTAIAGCLSCGSARLEKFLDLGEQPLANGLLPGDWQSGDGADGGEPRYPLGVQVCTDCWLVQLTDILPPGDLFSAYVYFSSNSDAMLAHARAACAIFTDRLGLDNGGFVVEVASNDGYLLRNFVERGIECLGVEPAENIAAVARERGVPTVCEFFGKDSAKKIAGEHRRADLILGNNVFAHVPDTNDFVAGLAELLDDDGAIALEFPYVREMVDHNEFDTIYHEHVFYFSLTALIPLFGRHGLTVFDVERLPIHGGSLRLWACHHGRRASARSVDTLLREEADAGLCSVDYYKGMGAKADRLRCQVLSILAEERAAGRRVAAYGASAKGSTLLNYCRPEAGLILFIVDRSAAKQGKLSPGLHLPIHAPERLLSENIDSTLLLTWNFADEIIGQQQAYRATGGKFIVPIPELRVVS